MTEFQRQRDLLTPGRLAGRHVDIVGAGALGGAILLCLCKMGCGLRNRVTITDFDHCELHNLPTQWFRRDHVRMGLPKVEAIAEAAEFLCERGIVTVQDRFKGNETRRLGPVVILAVDSIEERRRIWTALRERPDVDLLIDARMGAQVAEIRAVALHGDPCDDPGLYTESLHRPEEGFHEPCTRRSIMYTAFGAAAFVGSVFRSWIMGEPFPRCLVFDFMNFFAEVGSGAPAPPGPLVA